MKLIVTIFALVIFATSAMPHVSDSKKSEIKTWEAWNPNILNKANTANHSKFLNQKEKDIIFYLNLARMDGKLFVNTFLKDYEEKENLKNSSDYKSLIEELNNLSKLPPIAAQQDLTDEAKVHAKEMGKSDKIGHKSASGKLFKDRTKHLSKYTKLRECNEYGGTDALSILIYLLIDEDSKSKRRRNLLLDPTLMNVGIGSSFHVKYRTNTCILLGGESINNNLSAITE